MRCPFLREAQVKHCQASTIRKVIVRGQDDAAAELCMSPKHIHCSALKEHREDSPAQDRCPFLHESLMQYCGTSSVAKYIPYSESSLLRCGSDSHRYCDAYLTAALPAADPSIPLDRDSRDDSGMQLIDGIEVPPELSYTANHLWLDVSEDGICHIGGDSFLARILPPIEGVHFPAARGTVLPTAVLRVQGVDLSLTFPAPLTITSVNSYLRATPDRIRTQPYRAGWLFEGTRPHEAAGGAPRAGSLPFKRGQEAAAWLQSELRRLMTFVRDQIIPARTTMPGSVMTDGGELQQGFAAHLNHQELLTLFNEFFPPNANWRP